MATGRFPFPLPIPMGHEFVAEIVDTGSMVRDHVVGDIVVVPFQTCCGSCESCRAGLTANCDLVPPRSQFGFGAAGGDWGCGFADLVRVPFADAMLVPVPTGVSPIALAAAGDNLADGYRCVADHLERVPGGTVPVLGGIGSVPRYAAMFLGAARADFVDADSDRRRIAGGSPESSVPSRTGTSHLAATATTTLSSTARSSTPTASRQQRARCDATG